MKNTLKTLTVVAILLGSAAVADAAWRPRRWRFRRYRPIVRRRIIKPVLPRIVVPPRVIKPVVVPSTTVVVPAEPPAATELKAEIAKLKAKYNGLSQTRLTLQTWLAGPGKDRSAVERANARARLAKVDQECTLVAAQIAELESKLAEL